MMNSEEKVYIVNWVNHSYEDEVVAAFTNSEDADYFAANLEGGGSVIKTLPLNENFQDKWITRVVMNSKGELTECIQLIEPYTTQYCSAMLRDFYGTDSSITYLVYEEHIRDSEWVIQRAENIRKHLKNSGLWSNDSLSFEDKAKVNIELYLINKNKK